MDLKVFKVDDCDCIVAHSLEEATSWYKLFYNDDFEDYFLESTGFSFDFWRYEL